MIKKLKTTTKKSKPVTPINIDLTGKIINNVSEKVRTAYHFLSRHIYLIILGTSFLVIFTIILICLCR